MPRLITSDKDLYSLAAEAMLMHAAQLPLSSVMQRIVWRSDMRLFLMQLGADRATANLVNELLYWHRFKGLTFAESLVAARKYLSKPKRGRK